MKRRELLQRSAALGLGAAFPKVWQLSANAEPAACARLAGATDGWN